MAAALLLTAPFVPMLFQGEEWAASTPFQYFTDHEDPDLGRAVTEGRRREFAAFGWDPEDVPDPQAPETFARSKLRWDERHEGGHGRVLDWYRQLIAAAPAHPGPGRRRPRPPCGADADETTGLVVVRAGRRRPGRRQPRAGRAAVAGRAAPP